MNKKNEKTKSICLTAENFKGAIAFWAYAQCPNRNPRNMDKVMNAVENIIKTEFDLMLGNFRYKNFDNNDLYDYIREKLMSIPEFIDWNLSQLEVDKGISVDDPNRSKYSFTSGHDVIPEEDWVNGFVDLDAFIRNVHNLILMVSEF